ncbi:large ribosomal subunit protein bL33m isoform X4 [Narcine bancroftii]|uniref:large ribosomal subunit protein bL33m isoform X4 n=1 Tax=Narcine bancroftii TaxID=1343680 RepID=UPI0038310445
MTGRSATDGLRVAKTKSKSILVQMVSAAGTGYCFNAKRSRLRDKLVLRKHDPRGWEETGASRGNLQTQGLCTNSLQTALDLNSVAVNKHVLFFEKKKIRSI